MTQLKETLKDFICCLIGCLILFSPVLFYPEYTGKQIAKIVKSYKNELK